MFYTDAYLMEIIQCQVQPELSELCHDPSFQMTLSDCAKYATIIVCPFGQICIVSQLLVSKRYLDCHS